MAVWTFQDPPLYVLEVVESDNLKHYEIGAAVSSRWHVWTFILFLRQAPFRARFEILAVLNVYINVYSVAMTRASYGWSRLTQEHVGMEYINQDQLAPAHTIEGR